MPKLIVIKAERVLIEGKRCYEIKGCYNVSPESELPKEYLRGLSVVRRNTTPPGLDICEAMNPTQIVTPGMVFGVLQFLDICGKVNAAGDRLHRVNKLNRDEARPSWEGVEVIKI